MIKSIDVSTNNNIIDLSLAKNDIQLVWIKTTEGTTYVNPLLIKCYNQCKKGGLKVGFYHFLTGKNGKEQAQYFLSKIKDFQSDVPLCLDVEDSKIENIVEITTDFLDTIKSTGKNVILYTYESFYTIYLNSIKGYNLWIANLQSEPKIKYIGWQYTFTGNVKGIKGNVDLSYFDNSILNSNSKIETTKKDVTGGYFMKTFKNGSTQEKVYSDYNCTIQIGTLDINEKCNCIFQDKNRAIVLFKIDGTGNMKTGFVKYIGGIQ